MTPDSADCDPATLPDWLAPNPLRNLEVAGLYGEDDPWEKLLTQPVANKRLRELAQEALADEMNGRTTEITVTKDGRLAPA